MLGCQATDRVPGEAGQGARLGAAKGAGTTGPTIEKWFTYIKSTSLDINQQVDQHYFDNLQIVDIDQHTGRPTKKTEDVLIIVDPKTVSKQINFVLY